MSFALTLTVAFCVLLLASVLQTTVGFGLALISLPLLAMVFDARTAVVGCGLCGLLNPTLTTIRNRQHVQWRVVTGVLAGVVLGAPIGLFVFTRLSAQALTVAVALAAIGFTILIWSGLRMRAGTASVLGVGVVVGALSTSVGTNGPPLVGTFQAMGMDPDSFRATLAAVFLGTGVLSVTGFTVAGQVTGSALALAAVGIPAIALGWPLGNWTFSRIQADRFRHMVLGLLLVTSAAPLVSLVLV